jgi:hypothetical protein
MDAFGGGAWDTLLPGGDELLADADILRALGLPLSHSGAAVGPTTAPRGAAQPPSPLPRRADEDEDADVLAWHQTQAHDGRGQRVASPAAANASDPEWRCLDTKHALRCPRCTPPPSVEDESEFNLSGEKGKRAAHAASPSLTLPRTRREGDVT